MVNRAIEKANKIPRYRALQKSKKKDKNKGPAFVLNYDPRMPSVQPIQSRLLPGIGVPKTAFNSIQKDK